MSDEEPHAVSPEAQRARDRLLRIRPTAGKPALIGEGPSRRGDEFHRYPLSGPPSRVLCRLAGIEPDGRGTTYGRWYWPLRERFLARNLFERYADCEPWSAPRAREVAGLLVPHLPPVVVLLGVRVSAAFGVDPKAQRGYIVRPGAPTVSIYVVPHPSGLNRLYNDPAQRERAGEVLRWALHEALTGSKP